jgi:hypothetical protein
MVRSWLDLMAQHNAEKGLVNLFTTLMNRHKERDGPGKRASVIKIDVFSCALCPPGLRWVITLDS